MMYRRRKACDIEIIMTCRKHGLPQLTRESNKPVPVKEFVDMY